MPGGLFHVTTPGSGVMEDRYREEKTMSRLRSVAERLRSDNPNERLSAIKMIEKWTGLVLVDIIRAGAMRHLAAEPRQRVMGHISTKTGDTLVVSVSMEIARLTTSWGDIIETGSTARPTPSGSSASSSDSRTGGHDGNSRPSDRRRHWSETQGHARPEWPQPDFGDAWNSAFADFMANAGDGLWSDVRTDPPMRDEDIMDLYNSIKRARSGEERCAKVGREDLPRGATGAPSIVRRGTTKTGKGYAVVSFARMTTYGGNTIAPLCQFIAFGDEWIDEIEQAEQTDTTVSVIFGPDRDPKRHVVIHNAV